jgi:diguanylate cyclase (GGDEF)-like protein
MRRVLHAFDPRRLGCGSAFALRLGASFAAALVLVGVLGYVFMDRELRSTQIDRFAASQRADAATFELFGTTSTTHAAAISRIDEALYMIARRPGTLETLLIDRSGIVRASGDYGVVGATDMDPRIAAALRQGRSYAGLEADRGRNRRDFEFVAPVDLPGGRYAFETSYDHSVLNGELGAARRGLLLVGLLALLGGGTVFYLFGGRALLRAHRIALQRATRDGLTDLPNQRAFQDEFPLAIAAASRNQDALALMALDIDDFKFINDRHGHPHGDAILQRVAGVLREGRPGDRAYRIGGDEFVLVLPHTDADGARVLARRLLRNLGEARAKVTIGVSAAPSGHATEVLRAEADAALYEAKRHGGNQVAHFDDIRGEITVIGADKRAAVRALIEERRLTTVYQPIWDLAEGMLLGVEALARPHAEYGLSGPAEAFDIAEQVGHGHDLDMICIASALAHAGDLPDDALLFLNLCPSSLDMDADGDDWLRIAAENAGLAPERIVIEVTERFGGRAASIVKCLARLRAYGFKVAIDDIGTGNSGLAILRQVDVDFVKLDRTIVAAASTDAAARAVLLAIATYARETGAFVIAEGIEDAETLEFLRSIHERDLSGGVVIQGGQGYGLGRPAPAIVSVAPPPIRGPLLAPALEASTRG